MRIKHIHFKTFEAYAEFVGWMQTHKRGYRPFWWIMRMRRYKYGTSIEIINRRKSK